MRPDSRSGLWPRPLSTASSAALRRSSPWIIRKRSTPEGSDTASFSRPRCQRDGKWEPAIAWLKERLDTGLGGYRSKKVESVDSFLSEFSDATLSPPPPGCDAPAKASAPGRVGRHFGLTQLKSVSA